MKLKKIFLNNIGLKLLALLLAFVTWFYVEEATNTGSKKKTVLQRLLSPSEYITKELQVKPIFVGKAPDGHRFLENEVKVTPKSIIIVGSPGLLAKEEYIYTKPIDLSEYTKTKTLNVELRSFSRAVRLAKTEIQLFLPIEVLSDSVTEK